MLSQINITYYISINNDSSKYKKLYPPEGESMKVGFDGCIMLEFHGTKVISNGGHFAAPS